MDLVKIYSCTCNCVHLISTLCFIQSEACLPCICNSPIRVFPALFVLAGLCNQEQFCMPEMGFGVEETFQRFFLTLTPMFSLHIKLLGGPPHRFFPDHREGKMWSSR